MGDDSFDLRVLAAVVVVSGLVVGAAELGVLPASSPAPSDGQPMPSPPPVTTTSGAPGTTTPGGDAPSSVSVKFDVADPGDVRNGVGHVPRLSEDANEGPDQALVPAENVVGVVQFHVPYVGYVVQFANSDRGLLALVVVPAVLLAGSEVWSLWTAAAGSDSDDQADEISGETNRQDD